MHAVLGLPRILGERGDVSIYDLLVETGYPAVRHQVTATDIRDALRSCPEVVNDWLDYSESKRVSSGWYLQRQAPNRWLVGRYPDIAPAHYSDGLEACAVFLENELDDISAR